VEDGGGDMSRDMAESTKLRLGDILSCGVLEGALLWRSCGSKATGRGRHKNPTVSARELILQHRMTLKYITSYTTLLLAPFKIPGKRNYLLVTCLIELTL
jgi:hypothetical protein